MKKNVLIVGMARSGTSMTAAIFSRCGYFVAENEENQLQKADKFNPSGYWEAEKLLKANKEILSAVGFEYDNTWFHKQITEKQVSSIDHLTTMQEHSKLISQYNDNQPWVWKDPRLCYTLGYWWPLMDQENTCVLLLKRDSNEIFQSFLRVKSSWHTTIPFSKNEVFSRIEAHISSAENTLKKYNIPYLTIDYSDYKENPKGVAKKLNQYFSTSLSEHDIGYKKSADHSSIIGRISLLPEKLMKSKTINKMKKFFL